LKVTSARLVGWVAGLAAVLLVFVVLLGDAQARTLDEPIVGLWNYGGGVVQVSGSNGTFTGTIIKQTTLQDCPHEVGEAMWHMTGSNGTYSGTHLGFGTTCAQRESHPASWTATSTALSMTVSRCTSPLGADCGADSFTLTRAPAPPKPAWPKLPDALVSLESVSNGCGPGKASTKPRTFDTSTYRNSNNPFGKRYVVNFLLACNLHDAAYSGAKVADPLNGGVIDTFGWSKLKADEVFLTNMKKICDQAFKGTGATVALADCKGKGGKTSFGALSRYNIVTGPLAESAYSGRPRLAGSWSGQGVSNFVFEQNGRSVTATWTRGDLSAELRATVISRDQDSVIQGYVQSTVNGVTTQLAVSMIADPDTPKTLSVSGGGLPPSLTR